MDNMRKLMESVAPLFENPAELQKMLGEFERACAEMDHYGDVDANLVARLIDANDLEGAAEEMTTVMTDRNGGEASDDVFELAKEMVEDYMAEHGDMGDAMARYESVNEELSQDQIVEYIEELKEIMLKLQDLGDHATSIVSEIDPGEAQRLEAYGAFDFGTSSNQYDTTLASFIEDLESGQYDSMGESKEEACPNCGKKKHVLKACGSCGCS